jgi:hypothetical protein
MSAKPAKRNWNDVQTAIATAAIVTTLGMWNLFAKPAKTAIAQPADPSPSPTDSPTEAPASPEPTSLPYVKIIFTPGAPQIQPTSIVQQPQQPAPKKKKHRNNGGGGGSGGGNASSAPVTQTKSS